MSQTLKEEVRIAIINSAKKEFLELGYKEASMRSIASKAHMTVGNLYRYYKNKDDIFNQIVGPTKKTIMDIISKMSNSSVHVETRVFSAKFNVQQLNKMFNELADGLVNAYINSKEEFNILMQYSEVNKAIVEWFASIINEAISSSLRVEKYKDEIALLANGYAESLFAGCRQIFTNTELSQDDLNRLLKNYFAGYIYLLDADFHKFYIG